MRSMVGWPVVVFLAALAAGSISLHACGSTEDKRDLGVCDTCDPSDVDHDCLTECRQFCVPGEDCEPRCQVECDRCRADLACVECAGGTCAEPRFRCAPGGGATTCDNGRF